MKWRDEEIRAWKLTIEKDTISTVHEDRRHILPNYGRDRQSMNENDLHQEHATFGHQAKNPARQGDN